MNYTHTQYTYTHPIHPTHIHALQDTSLVITEADSPPSSGDFTTKREDRRPEVEARCLTVGAGSIVLVLGAQKVWNKGL